MAGEHFEEKERFDGQKVKILMPDYVAGSDEDRYQWRKNITYVNMDQDKDPIKKYLTTAERYFYSKEWFGSEKRKNPA
ncbi:MAG: hypothetical protein ACP5VS_11810 [Desulfomonilaceae bacterium]